MIISGILIITSIVIIIITIATPSDHFQPPSPPTTRITAFHCRWDEMGCLEGTRRDESRRCAGALHADCQGFDVI